MKFPIIRTLLAVVLVMSFVAVPVLATPAAAAAKEVTSSAAPLGAVDGSSVYVPITPCRIVDTRLAGGPLNPASARTWQVTGTSGITAQGGSSACGIPLGATAVEASVSAVGPASGGYLRVWPTGETPPTATFLNFSRGVNITNTGTVQVNAAGRIEARVFGASTHVVIDVQGYFQPAESGPLAAGASVYVPLTPCRIVDTRVAGGALAGSARTWQVTGSSGFAEQGGRSDCGIPSGATAVEISVSAVAPGGNGYLRAWPADQAAPTATFLNFTRGNSITNTGTIPVSADGRMTVRAFTSAAQIVGDVQGYFVPATSAELPATASTYVPITPCRIADTRVAATTLIPAVLQTWQVSGTSSFQAQGGRSDCGIPLGARAVEVSISAVAPKGGGYLRAWPSDAVAPTATMLNFSSGVSVTNTGTVTLSALGSINVRTFGAATQGVADVQGYYTAVTVTSAPLAIGTTSLTSAVKGLDYRAVLEASGGTSPYAWTATGLPAGLSVDGATGMITGAPLTTGSFPTQVSVSDSAGGSASATLSLDVTPGMPAECDGGSCFEATPAAGGVVDIPGDAVAAVSRSDAGDPTAMSLTAAAPHVAPGNYLTVGIGLQTPETLLLRVLSVQGGDGAPRQVSVSRAALFDVYPDGLTQGTGTIDAQAATAGAPQATPLAVTGKCNGSATVQAVPSVTTAVKPRMTVLWGRNLFGFLGLFTGSTGLEKFQFATDLDLTYQLNAEVSGSVSCSLDVPGVEAAIPLGPAGVATFELQPTLTMDASAKMSISTSVTLRCTIQYTWQRGSGGQTIDHCGPIVTPPTVDTAGADVTIGGSLAATLTYNEALGITGTLGAQLHAGYHPLSTPIGVIDGKVTGKLDLCLLCILGSAAPKLTILDGTILEKTFYTWGDKPVGTASYSGIDIASCIIHARIQAGTPGAYGMQVWDDGQLLGSVWTTVTAAGGTGDLWYQVRSKVLQGASGLGLYLVNSDGTRLASVDPYNGADSCFAGGAAAAARADDAGGLNAP